MIKINSDNNIKHIHKLYDEKKYNDVIDYILMFDEICFIKKDSIYDTYILNIVRYNHDNQLIDMYYISTLRPNTSSLLQPTLFFHRSYKEFIRREFFLSLKSFDIHFNKLKLTTKLNLI